MTLQRQPRVWQVTLAVLLALAVGLPVRTSSEASAEWIHITGDITGVYLGQPRGELTVNVDGALWLVQIGEPWRFKRAGLPLDQLVPGQEVTVQGYRTASSGRQVKAARMVIEGRNYMLYPDH